MLRHAFFVAALFAGAMSLPDYGSGSSTIKGYPSVTAVYTVTGTAVPYSSTMATYTSSPAGRPYGGPHPCDECKGWCGDNKVQKDEGEECDLGAQNGVEGSGCTKHCKKCNYCGDGHVDPGEACDHGKLNGTPGDSCSSTCTIVPCCGDGHVDPGEACDHGKLNGTPGDSCSSTCTIVSCCGDGRVDPGEACDHGKLNGTPGDSCSSNCTIVNVPCCGNGIKEPGEECDDGEDLNGSEYSHCTKECKRKKDCGCGEPPVCGNGKVEKGEVCDDGYLNGHYGSNCTTHCTLCDTTATPRCGDGHVDPGEDCDAGGITNDDCDAKCHWKTPRTPCETCDPNPFNNRCTITTSCISFLQTGKDYCACRAGYRANGLSPTDKKQFRLQFPGQEYRVFVAPGIDCDQLCTSPFPGPDSCQEVPVRSEC